MRYRLLMTALLAALAIAGVAPVEARMHAGPNMLSAGHRLRATIAPPLDGIATPAAAAYGFRRLRSAYTGPAVRLRRAADNLEADIGFTAAGDFNIAAAAAHCTSSCFVVTLYDQSGNTRNITNAGAAGQPAYIADCGFAKPCARTSAAGIVLSSASVTWASVTSSLSAVARRVAGPTVTCYLIGKNTNYLYTQTLANTWVVTDFTSASFDLPATDTVWHAAVAVIIGGGTPAVGRVDTVETVGPALTGTAAAGTVNFLQGAASVTCDVSEAMIWDGYALTLPERATLTAAQKAYWGF